MHNELKQLITKSILNEIPKHGKIGVLFSGGVDSTLIAKILKDNNIDFICYTTSSEEDYKDCIFAKKAAEELGFELEIVKPKNLEKELIEVSNIIENVTYVTVSIALPLYLSIKKASEDGITHLFSGLGTEELYAGYERHAHAKNINEECKRGLDSLKERDLDRDNSLAKYFNIALLTPFLNKDLISHSLKIPGNLKIKDGHKKYILRQVSEELGVPKEYAWRQKLAVQYGSGIDKDIERLAKSKGFKFKSDYVGDLLNIKVGALISTGKDSLFAMYKMMKKGYEISCLMTIKSKNEDSYMFHTPTIELASDISNSIGIPIIFQKTDGNKEDELKDLEKLIKTAIEQYKIQGIISGAIASEYQKKRIHNICNKLGIKSYTPLWGEDQEQLLNEMINKGFTIIITKTAAEGFDKKWIGRILDKHTLEELKKLSKTYNLNVMGEGGEYETLVVNAPFYRNEIKHSFK
ncbi:diphthine--ammonia ligase [Candidatus Micrarchaeota archaeon]|nr:diphthine--ammonia ligase [Candidatus Micrarchaeota archaeon]